MNKYKIFIYSIKPKTFKNYSELKHISFHRLELHIKGLNVSFKRKNNFKNV
jgi:hypothetical protein